MKVKFKLPSINEETTSLFDFCYAKNAGNFDWSDTVYKYHPKLKEMVNGVIEKDAFYQQCEKYTQHYLKENIESIEKARENLQGAWQKHEESFFTNLLKDFEIDYPINIKEIISNISINPICPRYLNGWSFNVSYFYTEERMVRICIHEIIHFFYFKKLLEIFPEYDRRKFESPYSEWRLSEILVISIINYNKSIQEIVGGCQTKVYDRWQSIKIGNEYLSDFFGNIYKKHLNGQISFADFLVESWDEYNKNIEVIESI